MEVHYLGLFVARLAFLADSQAMNIWKMPASTHVHGTAFVRGQRGKPTRKAPFIFDTANSLNKHSQGVQHQHEQHQQKANSISGITASAKAGKL